VDAFKALEAGCSNEKGRLETYHVLRVALSMFIPVAWRLLLARSISRATPSAPSSTIPNDVQPDLEHRFDRAERHQTAFRATLAIGKLGAHLKRNGPPGWQTLGRGFDALLLMAGRAARRQIKKRIRSS
jgi:hypothetical protein